MVVVCAIIGLIVSISFPSLASGLDSVRLSSATGSVASFLNAAVNRAERRQQAVEVVISPEDNSLVLYSNEPGFTRELHLPEGIAIEEVLDDSGEPGADGRRIVFLPGATVPGIGIQIGNRHGSKRIVRLDPMTGFPRVESVDSK